MSVWCKDPQEYFNKLITQTCPPVIFWKSRTINTFVNKRLKSKKGKKMINYGLSYHK